MRALFVKIHQHFDGLLERGFVIQAAIFLYLFTDSIRLANELCLD